MAKKNYKIKKNDTFGRYMVAAKSVKAGQLLLKEIPILVGPQLDGPLICFGCCRSVRNTGYIFCRNCNKAVICSPKCVGNLHTVEECAALKVATVNSDTIAEYDQIVFPLRCILLKKYNPTIWHTILELEPHLEKRRDTHIWRRHKIIVEQILKEVGFITDEDVKEELVQKICGILDVNTFEIRPPKISTEVIINPAVQCLRGLYLEAAFMAHDCVGNTHLSVDDDFVLTVHASVDIPEDSPIFFNYSNVLQGTIARKQHLREGKYFECSCTRCKDVSELGTNLSSLKCHRCHRGVITIIDPDQTKSDWKCDTCGKIFHGGLIKLTVEEGRRRVHSTDNSDINEMENLLTTLGRTFHPNHYLMLKLQQNIAGMYLSLPPTKKNLSRRYDLCQGLLEVFSKIEPGLSRMRAVTLYEMQSALADWAHKQFRDREITSDELILKLLSAEATLKEAIKHLLYEPSKSPEGKIAQRAMMELKMLRTSISNIQKEDFNKISQLGLSMKSMGKIGMKNNDQNVNTPEESNNVKETKVEPDSRSKRRRNRKKNAENS